MRLYVCTLIHIYIYALRLNPQQGVRRRVCVYMYAYSCIFSCKLKLNLQDAAEEVFMGVYVCMFVHMYVLVCMHIKAYVHVCKLGHRVRACVCVCTLMHRYMYVHVYQCTCIT
jgi:hypothetical protein